MKKLWKCLKCKREFKNNNQVHSCISYPLENHFKNKEFAKDLFLSLEKEIEKNVGKIKVESCIHLVSNYTFAGIWALKDRLRIDFRTESKINSKRIWKTTQMSPNRTLYCFEIKDKKDINKELLGWLKEAYYLNY